MLTVLELVFRAMTICHRRDRSLPTLVCMHKQTDGASVLSVWRMEGQRTSVFQWPWVAPA